MPQTPATSAAPYCDAESLWAFVDWRTVADLLNDADGSPPTQSELEDPTDDAGAMLEQALLAASGELESACLARQQYTAADLGALVAGTAGHSHLIRVVAGLTIGILFGRRYPASGKWEELPAVRYAADTLDRLRTGERVFGFVENTDAGAGMEVTPAHPNYDATREKNTVGAAFRFFGERGYRVN